MSRKDVSTAYNEASQLLVEMDRCVVERNCNVGDVACVSRSVADLPLAVTNQCNLGIQ